MYETIIIGAGASGSACACNLSGSTLILERNNEIGRKILATGNGRCNYTNENQELNHYHSVSNPSLIEKIITTSNLKLMNNFFNDVGIIPRIKNDYYYPYSNQASSIRNSLLNTITNKKIKINYNTYVKNIIKEKDSYKVITDKNTYIAKNIVIANGSMADSKTGSDGSGYELLKKLNLNLIKPLPALVQLKTSLGIEKKWAGIRQEVSIKNYENNKLIKEENGELQLTDYGISGICAMQLSSNIARGLDKKLKEEVEINFLANLNIDKTNIEEFLINRSHKLNSNIENTLICLMNYKLLNVMFNYLSINPKNKYEDLTSKEKDSLNNFLVALRIEITGTNSFNQAQICSGGLDLNEINPTTMELIKYPHLYVVGELLDIHGDCGGYNLTLAWISGILAARSINND